MTWQEESPYEDGTNILLGTPHFAEFTDRVLPWYNPAESVGSISWKEKWSALRSRFERLIDSNPAVECFLIQRRFPACGSDGNESPPRLRAQNAILDCGGLRTEPARLFDHNWCPLIGSFPIKNAKGDPLRNEDGTNLALRFGLRRRLVIQPKFGYSDDFGSLPVPVLNELASDAAQLLYQLPQEVANTIWRNWRSGFSRQVNSGSSLWFDALFELSWQHPVEGPLYSRRYAWQDNFSVQLAGNGSFPRLPEFQISNPNTSAVHEAGYPVVFYAKLNDVVRSSLAAIDEIFERERALTSISKKRFRIGLSFPGEHRGFIEKVAQGLASGLGEKRVLYDQYHEAEFARPDLDIYLPNLYRTECDLIAIFLCADYSRKRWCKLEWRFIRQLIGTIDSKRIMFLSFDDIGSMPELGILDGDGYLSIRQRSTQVITSLIEERLRQTPVE